MYMPLTWRRKLGTHRLTVRCPARHFPFLLGLLVSVCEWDTPIALQSTKLSLPRARSHIAHSRQMPTMGRVALLSDAKSTDARYTLTTSLKATNGLQLLDEVFNPATTARRPVADNFRTLLSVEISDGLLLDSSEGSSKMSRKLTPEDRTLSGLPENTRPEVDRSFGVDLMKTWSRDSSVSLVHRCDTNWHTASCEMGRAMARALSTPAGLTTD